MDQPQGMGGMPPQAPTAGYPQQRVQSSAPAPQYGSPAGGGYGQQQQQPQQQQQYQQQAPGYGQYNGNTFIVYCMYIVYIVSVLYTDKKSLTIFSLSLFLSFSLTPFPSPFLSLISLSFYIPLFHSPPSPPPNLSLSLPSPPLAYLSWLH